MMELSIKLIFLFIEIRWLDVLDVLLVAYLIYRLYFIVKGTSAINIFLGILSIYVLWKIVEAFQMEMLSEILGQFIGVGVIALFIVFQQEIRKFLLSLGNRGLFMGAKKSGLFGNMFKSVTEDQVDLKPIIKACHYLSKKKIGALIVIARKSEPSLFIIGGQDINAKLNSDLIISIFQKESPLHDGAMIVNHNKIEKAQCVLSLSENTDMPEGTGLRHRSALGIAEQTDAIAVVISEQTGSISIAHDSRLLYNLAPDLFDFKLMHFFEVEHRKKKKM
jgi:diadenylate cyclase